MLRLGVMVLFSAALASRIPLKKPHEFTIDITYEINKDELNIDDFRKMVAGKKKFDAAMRRLEGKESHAQEEYLGNNAATILNRHLPPIDPLFRDEEQYDADKKPFEKAVAFQGDIILNAEQWIELEEEEENRVAELENETVESEDDSDKRQKRNFLAGTDASRFGDLWNERIQYFIVPYLYNIKNKRGTQRQISEIIRDGMHWLNKHTCLTFEELFIKNNRIEKNTIQPALMFTYNDTSGCNSPLGRGKSPVQKIHLHPDCVGDSFGVPVHEVLHALGFAHEMSRSDRDQYLAVNYKNLRSKSDELNFAVEKTKNFNTLYDYGSIMHYGATTNSIHRDKPTLVTIDPLYQMTIGWDRIPSFNDHLRVNKAYGCYGKCKQKLSCQHDGYQLSSDCGKCLCPDGFGGKLCAGVEPRRDVYKKNGKCGGVLYAKRGKRQKLQFRLLSGGKDSSEYTTCTYHIKAPKGQFVRLEKKIEGYNDRLFTQFGCNEGFFEVKTGKPNYRRTGPRDCVPDDLHKATTETGSPLIVIRGFTRRFDIGLTFYYESYKASDPKPKKKKQPKRQQHISPRTTDLCQKKKDGVIVAEVNCPKNRGCITTCNGENRILIYDNKTGKVVDYKDQGPMKCKAECVPTCDCRYKGSCKKRCKARGADFYKYQTPHTCSNKHRCLA